jgi:uncharacterized protein involved in exopolysaccharide biosynthesis
MVSVWWIVVAFIGGGFLGILVIALMRMARDQPKQTTNFVDFNSTTW